jgi:threonylcarbamoyladenosine tRNA methylthiotransferase MtaB
MPVEIVTLGCRLNIAESEAIRAHAEAANHDNVIIVNTCAVTAGAMRQARKTIRKLKREQPDARIIVTGCAAQVEPERFAEMGEVSLVLGNDDKMRPETWARLKASNSFGANGFSLEPQEKLQVSDIMQAGAMQLLETAAHLSPEERGHTRAFVQVQNGCDHRCTFCIIPFGRGPSRSAPMGAVVDAVRRHVDAGVKEVVLTGVDTTSYGGDLPGAPQLGALVQAILRHVPDLPRLRLSSIDAIEIDSALREALASETRLMPHLHLSLQHGDDLILKRMKRRHNRDDAIRLCDDIRVFRPDIVFGADIIAGFPTEDEAMFANSLDLVEACGITWLHVFPFSPREGTPAARMPQLPASLIRDRAARLRAAGDRRRTAFLDGLAGTVQSILTEQGNTGHTEGFATVRFADDVAAGEIVMARIVGRKEDAVMARVVPRAIASASEATKPFTRSG